jgi:hypothetical protein
MKDNWLLMKWWPQYQALTWIYCQLTRNEHSNTFFSDFQCFFFGIEVWTQSFVLQNRGFYHLSQTSSSVAFFSKPQFAHSVLWGRLRPYTQESRGREAVVRTGKQRDLPCGFLPFISLSSVTVFNEVPGDPPPSGEAVGVLKRGCVGGGTDDQRDQ